MEEKVVQTEQVPYQFHGKSGEFFGIWVVNVILSIITLGIYSAWAKVRTYKYFYGNTELDGHRFNYLATPMQILKGRVVAVVLFLAFSVLSNTYPQIALVLILLLFIALPYLICSSLRFETRMTSYRNVRFNFTGSYGEAFLCFIVLPIVSVFTLYLLFPYTFKRMNQFIIDNCHYGNRAFKSEMSAGTYYLTAFFTLLIAIAAMILIGVCFAVFGVSLDAFSGGDGQLPSPELGLIGIIAAYVILFTLVKAFYQARIRNHILDNTVVEDVANFRSHVQFASLAFLQLTNVLALMCTLGLALPWTKIRTAKYFVDCTEVHALAGKDNVIDELNESSSALGDEVANAFDIDIALT